MFLSLMNAEDLLNKIKQQLHEFQNNQDSQRNSYLLFDIILSLNALLEWVWNDVSLSEDKRNQCIVKFNPYKKISQKSNNEIIKALKVLNVVSYNQFQYYIREISNSSKHFSVKSIKPEKREYQSCFYGYPGENIIGTELQYAFVENHIKYLITDDNKEIDLLTVIVELINEWSIFIT